MDQSSSALARKEQTPTKKKKVCKIADLSPSKSNERNWPICGKVVKIRPKCEPKIPTSYIYQYFKCWVKDDTGTIEVLANNRDADVFEDKLLLDEVYYISDGVIRRCKLQKYGDNFHAYEIVLNEDSTVEPCLNEQDGPDSSFSQLQLITEQSIGEDTVDVVGILEHVDPVEIKWTQHGDTPLRKIIISDRSGQSLPIALWKDKAENFDAEVNSVIALRRLKAKQFRGDMELSSCMFTRVEVNPSLPEAEDLRRMQSDGADADGEALYSRDHASSVSRRLFQDYSPAEDSGTNSSSVNQRGKGADDDRKRVIDGHADIDKKEDSETEVKKEMDDQAEQGEKEQLGEEMEDLAEDEEKEDGGKEGTEKGIDHHAEEQAEKEDAEKEMDDHAANDDDDEDKIHAVRKKTRMITSDDEDNKEEEEENDGPAENDDWPTVTRKKTRMITSDDEDSSDAETVSYSPARALTDTDNEIGQNDTAPAKRTLSDSEGETDEDTRKRSFKRIHPVESSQEIEVSSDSDGERDDDADSCRSTGSSSDSDSQSESGESSVMDSQESVIDKEWQDEQRELMKDPLFEKVYCYLYWMTMKAFGEVVREPDIMTSVQKLEGDIQVKLGVCYSSAWCELFREAVMKYPEYRNREERGSSSFDWSCLVDCEACNRSNHPWSYKVTFGGRPYRRNTYEEVTDDGAKGSDYLFHLGRFCYERSRLYSKLYHWRYHLFKRCKRKLDQLDDDPDKVLEDRLFLKEVYSDLKQLMEATLQEYTDDGNQKKRFKQREIDQTHFY